MGATSKAPVGLRGPFQRVLDLAPEYSWTYDPPTTAMLERQATLQGVATDLGAWLGGGDRRAAFDAEAGGRFGSMAFARVPWIRVFSERFAPNVLAGYFLLWLFAAEGSHMYLSLTKGIYVETAEGRWEPCGDPQLVRSWSQEARRLLEPVDKGKFTQIGLDLGSDDLPADAASRQRIEAYELGNIYGIRYLSGQLPNDFELLEDLLAGLRLLIELLDPDGKRQTPTA